MTSSEGYLVVPKQGLIDAVVRVPGSKSIANRALICAALARGVSGITGLPDGNDTAAMLRALTTLGSKISQHADSLRVDSPIDINDPKDVVIDARLAGTTARFMTAVGALRAGSLTIDGDEPLRKRPMEDLHRALVDAGALLSWNDREYFLPVTVRRGPSFLPAVQVAVDTSSQFVTALMLIAPMLVDGLRIELVGKAVSQPYITMSAAVMRSFGANVEIMNDRLIVVQGGGYVGCDYVIEPDASSASYPLAATAIVGGRMCVSGVMPGMMQGDSRFIEIMAQMGCDLLVEAGAATLIRDPQKPLLGVDLDMSDMSDLVPTLAVVAMFASTPTRIRNIGFIRNKESDRIRDLASEMRVLGAHVVEHEDGLEVIPQPLHGGRCDTHHDHRLAMAIGVAGLRIEGVVITNPQVVTKSWPGFWAMLEAL